MELVWSRHGVGMEWIRKEDGTDADCVYACHDALRSSSKRMCTDYRPFSSAFLFFQS